MRTAEDFIALLSLTDAKFSNIRLNGIVMNIYDFASMIWQSPRLFQFVDHGIDHSYMVIEKALKIYNTMMLTNLDLTSLERTVIGIAGLIHDIGMQYSKYPKPGMPVFDDEGIRKRHCELGYEMIMDTLKGTFQSERAGPPFPPEEYHKMFLNYGALVGFAHSGTKYWEQLQDKIYDDKKEASQQLLRIRLLAALLRFGDELDCEYTRIKEFNLLTSSTLNAESKAHWAACYYINEMTLKTPRIGVGINITMKWRVPQSATDTDIKVIKTLLTDLRERKINQEKELIKNYLKSDSLTDSSNIELIVDSDPLPSPIQTPPSEVIQYVKNVIKPYEFGIKRQETVAGAAELVGSPTIDDLKKRTQQFIGAPSGMSTGHYRLKTGWHTNKLFKCRELCSQPYFSLDLGKELTKTYRTENLTDILAIGTSAIEIGSILSLMLKTKFDYTFRNLQIRDSRTTTNDYTDYEMEARPSDSARLLIIDDILGVGSVATNVITQLKQNLSKPPEYIRIFTIFMLGSEKEFVSKLSTSFKNIMIDYLYSVPDVKYFKELNGNHKCDFCKAHPEINASEEY